jgi:catechol 2,3-dioxygenase-like lactoylglutathione lyase family enzyme
MHKWYTRPVLFVSDVNRSLHFYVGLLGFEKTWHAFNKSTSKRSTAGGSHGVQA